MLARFISLARYALTYVFLAAAMTYADQPQFKAMLFDGSAAPMGAGAGNAAEQPPNRDFYYSGGKIIYQYYTGLAVVNLKQGVNADSPNLKIRASAAAPTGPVAELLPMLRRNGMIVVTTEGPNALDASKAATALPDEVAQALPIVQP